MNSEQTKVDKFLDDTLRNYCEAEPRIGFELRILANLRTAPEQRWWHRKLAYASVAAIVACVTFYGVWRFGITSVNPQLTSPKVTSNRVHAPEIVRSRPLTASSVPVRRRALKQAHTGRKECEHQHTALASQLPVPKPLSEQEKLLLAFVRENPNEVISTIEWQEQMRRPLESAAVSDRGEQQ